MCIVFLKEQEVKVQMINEIIKYSDKYNSKKELASKNFSVIKFMYYDYVKPGYQVQKLALWNLTQWLYLINFV